MNFMFKKLALLVFMVWTFSCHAMTVDKRLPIFSSGLDGLEREVKALGIPHEVIKLNVSKTTSIVTLRVNIGSGVFNGLVYVYICEGDFCQLMASRYSGEHVLSPKIENGNELVLVSERGVVFLKVPIVELVLPRR